MALTERKTQGDINIVSDVKHIIVTEITEILRDGAVISSESSNTMAECGNFDMADTLGVRNIADALWTAELIATHKAHTASLDYTAMGHIVSLINAIIAGTQMADDTAEKRQATVDRNVEHLELMVAKDYWTDEDMTAVNSAITAGQGYTA
jgi:hypothetical protein